MSKPLNPPVRARRRALMALTGLGALALSHAAALAQSGGLRPPEPEAIEDAPILLTYFAILVMGALIVGANAIPSKRGHQD